MFDTVDGDGGAAALRALVQTLSELDQAVSSATRIDRIRALEQVKAACAAAQARDAAGLHASLVDEQAAAGVPAAERGRGVAAQVALARRQSPHRGARHLGLALALVHEMPHTLMALATGRLDEWRTTLLVRETATLTREDRSAVDTELAATPAALSDLEQLGDRALAARARQAAYRLDPHSVTERARRAVIDRCVTVRPAPDTMAWLTALLPARDAIATHAALTRAAEHARNTGDPRSRGQLMADTLVTSVTGSLRGGGAGTAEVGDWQACWAPDPHQAEATTAAARRPGPEDVAVRLVMTDRALLARPGDPGHDEPAHLDGYGPVPAAWARELVASILDPDGGHGTGTPGDLTAPARVFVKRLLLDRAGAVTAMDSRARRAPTSLAALIRTRDGTCRTPWCDAPVRHVDHITPYARGGPTTSGQLQGLCEACNHTKQLPGWSAQAVDPGIPGIPGIRGEPGEPGSPPLRHTVDTTTPTGHTYRSVAPLLPAVATEWSSEGDDTSDEGLPGPIEQWLEQLLSTVACPH